MDITKDWFIETIKLLEKIKEEEFKNNIILSDMWRCYVTISNPLWDIVENLFTNMLGKDIVSYYLLEDHKLVRTADGKEWHLDTPEQLWEYVESLETVNV